MLALACFRTCVGWGGRTQHLPPSLRHSCLFTQRVSFITPLENGACSHSIVFSKECSFQVVRVPTSIHTAFPPVGGFRIHTCMSTRIPCAPFGCPSDKPITQRGLATARSRGLLSPAREAAFDLWPVLRASPASLYSQMAGPRRGECRAVHSGLGTTKRYGHETQNACS